MTLALDHNTYNQLLTKFQPKIIENEEEYEQARHLLLNLISKQYKRFNNTEKIIFPNYA